MSNKDHSNQTDVVSRGESCEQDNYTNKQFYERVYEDFKEMDIEITADVAEGVACYARMHDNPEDTSSDIIAQWVDQHMSVDLSPDLITKNEFMQYSPY